MKQNEKFVNEYLKNISTYFSCQFTIKSYLSFWEMDIHMALLNIWTGVNIMEAL